MNDPLSHMPARRQGVVEFVALMAMLNATVALSIDAMLPAMPEIAAGLTPGAPNLAQLVITSFVLGLGVGTFLAGPLADSLGRKPVVLWGAGLYMTACILAWIAPSLELLVAARILQGLGAATARIVPIAIVRDLYQGRGMARIVSFIMMVFTLVPAVAPLMGSGIIAISGWRAIFLAFMLFAVVSSLWLATRVDETLPKDARKPFRAKALIASAAEVLRHPVVRRSAVAQALCMTALFASLSSIHQIFDITYGRAAGFPWWFAGIALVAGGFNLLNASVVMRLGMHRLILIAMICLIGLTTGLLLLNVTVFAGGLPFSLFLLWQTAIFIHTAMTIGNLNAMALEPMGHLAGTAASVFTGFATLGAVLLTIPIGLMFNGTPIPLMIGALLSVSAALALIWRRPQI